MQGLRLTDDDVLFDLGCGTADWCIAASKASGCRSVGIELSPAIAKRARSRVTEELGGEAASSSLVRIEVRDLMAPGGLDGVEEATVVVLYMAREASRQLSPELRSRLKAGTRVIAVLFSIPGWVPVRVESVKPSRVFHYVVEVPGGAATPQVVDGASFAPDGKEDFE